MAGTKRPVARIKGASISSDAIAKLGREIKRSRERRRLHQQTLANRAGISRALLSKMEAGRASGTPPQVWFALAVALDRYLKFEFARDPLHELADAGHADIQEFLLRVAKPCGYQGGFELRTRTTDPSRSIDVPLVSHQQRRLVIAECWNTFGDLGGAARSSHQKQVFGSEAAVVLGGDNEPYEVGLCWVVRDTKRNRDLVARYQHIFDALLPGSSLAWVKALTVPGAPMPGQPGLVWCDVRAGRLFARRREGRASADGRG
jgi:transcriptional regulator with XRE-family HTH domain